MFSDLAESPNVVLFDTLDFLLNEYFIELNTANFNILNKFLNWILLKQIQINKFLNWILSKNYKWIKFWIEFCRKIDKWIKFWIEFCWNIHKWINFGIELIWVSNRASGHFPCWSNYFRWCLKLEIHPKKSHENWIFLKNMQTNMKVGHLASIF